MHRTPLMGMATRLLTSTASLGGQQQCFQRMRPFSSYHEGSDRQGTASQVERVYQAIALGCPKAEEGIVETNIGRDIRDRKKMGVFPYMSSR